MTSPAFGTVEVCALRPLQSALVWLQPGCNLVCNLNFMKFEMLCTFEADARSFFLILRLPPLSCDRIKNSEMVCTRIMT